ncbi:MAG: branched-chain amino acid ABC transporter permease [Betaproteobacteria bacterium]|uniref:Putative ABC-type branched-chain amino acid transport system, permease component n=1 Tax=Thiomonas delicata TaxID=364030 RepID=A0A238D8A8_THIDL|nr:MULTISPECIES: branched-chain amino acid ABC transporter permease [Thiomonas]MDE2128425.1 branched-chain amino acid ABC transporter permease [Betaproteobacteria bacterium]SBP89553.1 putative ABC-type branched-chain amino acid transport system, permease component [Thiomonas delicata]
MKRILALLRNPWVGAAIWVLGLAVPFGLDQTWVFIASLFAVYAIVALSQDIVLGRAGMFDMGHAVYFGVGAYVTAVLNTQFNWPILATWPLAVLLAAFVGALLAAPIVKLRGDYLLVATIGFNAIFILALDNNVAHLTGGADGIFGIGVPSLFGWQLASQNAQFWLDWLAFAAVLLLVRNLDRSHLGRTLFYIKHDQLAATTMGVDARAYRVLAYALGAGLAGFGGTLFATLMAAVSPGAFVFTESVTLFAIVLVGGQGSIPGVLLGTVLMFVVPQAFRSFAQYRYFVFGIAMVVVMVLRPQGIWPRAQRQEAKE